MSQLALYESAKEALAAAVRIDEVVDIRNDADRARAYAKIARDRRLQADAAELVARAERKLGILLRRAKNGGLLSQGGRPAERSNLTEPETGADGEPVFDHTPFTLSDIGVDKKLSSRAQKLAGLGEDDFESVVTVRREQILSSDAPVVSPPRVKPPKADKPAKVAALEPRRFHQFAFSVLALSVASDRVGSRAIQFLARDCGLLGQGEDNLDFTPAAEAAMGNILVAALNALGEQQELPGTATEQRVHVLPQHEGSGAGAGETAQATVQNVGVTRPGEQRPTEFAGNGEQGAHGGTWEQCGSATVDLSESVEVPSEGDNHKSRRADVAPSFVLPTAEADAIIRAGYAAEPSTPVGTLAWAIGRPDSAGKAYVRNRARVMKISSRDNQRAAASAFAHGQHAARRGEGA